MSERPYTGPTGFRLTEHGLHIDGYPDADRVVQLTSRLGRRLADLRLHEATLDFCEMAMQELGREHETSNVRRQAILTGVVAAFFSCFGENKAIAQLSPNRVFKGNTGAKECFRYWRALRDKLLIHNESAMASPVTGVVLGPRCEVQDIISLQFGPALVHEEEHLRLLYNLITHTLEHVRGEVQALLPRVFEEVRAMPTEERAALPPVSYTAPTADAAFITRTSAPAARKL